MAGSPGSPEPVAARVAAAAPGRPAAASGPTGREHVGDGVEVGHRVGDRRRHPGRRRITGRACVQVLLGVGRADALGPARATSRPSTTWRRGWPRRAARTRRGSRRWASRRRSCRWRSRRAPSSRRRSCPAPLALDQRRAPPAPAGPRGRRPSASRPRWCRTRSTRCGARRPWWRGEARGVHEALGRRGRARLHPTSQP